jgi:hypothetical protein
VPIKQRAAVKKKTAPKEQKVAPKKRSAPVETSGAKERAEAVKKILLNVEQQMSTKGVKASLGDYIRLIQLSKEMTDEPKTAITVTWIEE